MRNVLIILTLICVIGVCCHVSAGVIVNEAMSDGRKKPVGVTWIELYNDSDTIVVLTGMSIASGGIAMQLSNIMVQSRGYLVICNRTIGPGAFESRWGDSSGVWGDRGFESTFMLVELPIASLSVTDSVVLSNHDGTRLSELYWSADSSARSWERVSMSADSAMPCLFGAGGTPGEINSPLAVNHDLSIESVIVRPVWPSCEIAVTLKNVGTEVSLPTSLVFTQRSSLDRDTIATIAIPALSSGASRTLTANLAHNGTWQPAMTLLDDDDRLSNNHKSFMIVGDDYPPLVLSEIMAAPLPNSGGEWIEIRRRSDTAVNLQGWSIRDRSRLALLSDSSLYLNDSIAVVVQSESDFIAAYGNSFITLIRPGSWTTLNNGGDIVRLVDPFGIEADVCAYDALLDDGKTLARSADATFSGSWQTSIDQGGTPGFSNRVLEESSSEPGMAVSPQTISPDGDGRDDEVVFTIIAPSAAHCTMRIFDRSGRVVCALLSDQPLPSNEIKWDGRDTNGGRLRIGIYVALLEVSGGSSVRKAVVLAR